MKFWCLTNVLNADDRGHIALVDLIRNAARAGYSDYSELVDLWTCADSVSVIVPLAHPVCTMDDVCAYEYVRYSRLTEIAADSWILALD